MKGRHIVVTGAFGALGTAVVKTLEGAGAKVAQIDRAPKPKTVTGLAFGDIDIADPVSAMRVFADAEKGMGDLDGLVNVAGTFRWETLQDGSLETWDFLYNVNLKTALVASKTALPYLLKSKGAIVNVSAAATMKAAAGMGAYTASKSGVSRLTESLAEETKAKGVRVNAVLPTIINTPQNRKDMPDADFTKWVTPDALAEVIVFLLSDKARAITGALIPVAGRV
jgi:NAD(P)-dependent dehydrogenase (short-subunit alcohol dehydrogenase family)